MPHKQEAHAFKKQLNKKINLALSKANEQDEDAVSRIITFGSMPSYREDKMQEMKSRQASLKGESTSDSGE